MKGQGVRGRAIAGDCWDPGALRDGNYGSRSLALSMSVLLACCPLHGFIRPRSKCEGRKASQQKCSVNKDLPHQQSCGKGDACHSPLPHNHAFLTQRLSIYLSSHSAKPQSPMLVSFGRAPAPGVTSATAGPMDDSSPKLPITGKGWPVPWKLK